MGCRYPNCDCSVSFPEGYKPSELTECPYLKGGEPPHRTSIHQVAEFHRTFSATVLDRPGFPAPETMLTRLHLIQEELSELALAMATRDIVGVLDALCDLQYVVDGAFLNHGLAAVKEAAFAEVHRSNMSKLGADGRPVLGPTGRVIKGPLYSPPELTQFLYQEDSES